MSLATHIDVRGPRVHGPRFDPGQMLGYALTTAMIVGIAALVFTAAGASECTGTALTQADLRLPVLTV